MSRETESQYAQKVRRRKQMYGPGCCAHAVKVPYPPKHGLFWWEDKEHLKALGMLKEEAA